MMPACGRKPTGGQHVHAGLEQSRDEKAKNRHLAKELWFSVGAISLDTQPSMAIRCESSTSWAFFFGTVRLRMPLVYVALMSSPT